MKLGSVIGQNLSHYKIAEEISRGGMGVVYRAWDTTLNREAAIKVLSKDLVVSDPDSRQRFIQEAKATAALDHPYIATVYEVGEAEGVTYIAMELIRGRELAELIKKGELDADKAIDLAVEVAEALAFAHDKGIIHRDLKPANIMVTDEGHVKIIDFGLAKLTQPLPVFEEGDDTAERAPSRSDFVKGTLSYMSPEQARGKPLDPRCDIFSFGIVLYEMIAGKNPFTKDSTLETAHAIIHAPAPSLLESGNVDPDQAARIQPIVTKCLEKDPAARFDHSRTLMETLKQARLHIESSTYIRFTSQQGRVRRLKWGGVFALSILAVSAIFWNLGPGPPKAVAVLPWTYDSAGEGANLGQLIPLALNDRLRDLDGVDVTPFSDSRTYAPDEDTGVVAAQLGVEWVVRGRLDVSGGKVTANVSLEGSDGPAAGWPRDLTADIGNVVELADDLAASIAGELGAGTRGASGSTAGHIAYLEGRSFLWGWDVEQNALRAEEAFRRSIVEDELFAEAHAGLSLALWRRYLDSNDATLVEGAFNEAQRAVVLDPDLAEARLALGVVQLGRGRSVDAAATFEKALSLAPADDAVCRRIAEAYEALGRIEDAEAMYQRAIDLRPGYWENYARKGMFYVFTKTDDLEKAVPLFREVIRLRPESDVGYNNLALVQIMSGEHASAEPLLQAALRINPNSSAYNNLGIVYWTMGSFEEALEQFRLAIESSEFEDAYYVTGLADTLRQLDRTGEAKESYARAAELWKLQLDVNPSDDEARGIYSTVLAGLGRCEEATQEALDAAPMDGDVPYHDYLAAIAHSVCEDEERALFHMERAIRGGVVMDVQVHPDLVRLLDDPSLAEALREATDGES